MSVETVDSADDARLAGYRDWRDPVLRRVHGLFVAETPEVVRTLLAAGRWRVRSVLLTASHHARLAPELAAAGVPALVASHAVLQAVLGYNFHRGCIALVERGAEPAVDQVLTPWPELVLLLEDLTDQDNVGAVFRSARAFGAGAVVLSPRCADPLYREVVRVSMGAVLRLPWARDPAWPAAATRLRAAGYEVVALTPRADAVDITRLRAAGRRALLLGAEGRGLSAAAEAATTLAARIPMAPGVDSLNVGAAAAIALHRLARTRSRT